MGDTTNRETFVRTPQIAFDYIKGNYFRVAHADGVIGGLTPSGNVHMAFYSERGPIPQKEVHAVLPDGSLGEVLSDRMVVRPGIIREMDIDIVMSPDVAKNILRWLTEAVEELDKGVPSGAGSRSS